MAAVELTVFHVILLFWSLRTAESQVMTLSGCEPNCGGIAIPYPFGMTEGCSLDKRFKIHCDSISGDPTLTVNGTDLVVRHISVYSSTIYVMFPIVFENCGVKDRNTVVDLEGSPFVFSSENYFVATGCNNLALMNQHNSAIGGCVSICDENRDPWIAGCSGINCCQTRIPSNLKVFNVTMKGVDGDSDPYGMKDVDSVGAVLDWGIDRWLLESLVSNAYLSYTSYQSTGTTYGSYRRKIKAKMAGLEENCVVDLSHDSDDFISSKKTQILCVGVGFGALFLLIGLWWLYKVFKRKRGEKLKKKYFKRNGGLLLQEQLSSGEVNVEKIKMFPSKELDKATDHYNANRTLGQGGQGTVYKGMLADGKIVAVKKSKVIDEGNLRQFINEVVLLSQINHRNVVKLLGCSLETGLPLLVYEFIPNGTLFQFLHDPNEEFPLTWEMRLRIAEEVAGALFYLHSAASIAIFHRDIKSTNILRDEKYRAKVADFGISRSKPISFTRSEEQGISLAMYFLMAMEINCLFDILDPQVVKQGKKEDVVMVANLARSCLRLNGKERPTMKEVTMVFERIQKSENLIVQREIEYDRKEVMGAPWDATSTSTISNFGISASASLDEKPLLHTY
ncbi:hypothetical protein DKX38_028735 [Salix brachista]|uniref:Protein kinase domain-containing protein n=1 Tax=Salix brachista TaxID=2182728 RepID=A0A5N5J683_9ROSI|nr:hypothetical protein DKX38_028735 [Salix brachista]